ncbi:putative signaling protein [Pandoraea terrae]|uniref:Putative signaling protein n=1 Tax=Pandoraea terrae TaxID=1537710 RepID=A0A5E4XJI7_9BURK|nr:EAL domain-containing protein [Pandoraea terrae]VVE36322.1 putative signaling protein [Pandoraea terrae]
MRLRSRLLSLLPAWIVLVLAVASSVALYRVSGRLVEREVLLKFDNHAGDVQDLIETRVRLYSDVLVSLQAFFAAREHVSRQEFHDFYNGLNLSERYPGFQLVNYARYVPASELEGFLAGQRDDPVLRAADISFIVKPPGARPAYNILTYVEPLESNLASLGVDVAAEPARLRALEQSRDTGQLLSSGRTIRPQGPRATTGIALRLPVYRKGMPIGTVEQRRLAYVGSVGAGIRVDDLMRGLLDNVQLRELHFKIYDVGPLEAAPQPLGESRLLFDSTNLLPKENPPRQLAQGRTIKRQMPLRFGGRRWIIDFSAQAPSLMGSDRYIPDITLGCGLAIAILLSVLTHVLTRSRARALVLANQMTYSLRESEVALAEAQRIAHLGSWSYDPRDGVVSWSDELARLLGKSKGRTTLEDFLSSIDVGYRTQLLARIDAALYANQGFEVEVQYHVANGRVGWLHLIGRPPASGQRHLLRGTAMEITHRKLAERTYQLEHAVTLQLAIARTDTDIIEPIVKTLCNGMHWDAASFWPTRAGEIQAMPQARFTDHPGLGPWLSRGRSPLGDDAQQIPDSPKWRNRKTELAELPHAEWLAAQGISTMLSFPLRLESTLLGVMEFYSRKRLPADRSALAAAESIVNQIEQYMRRRRAEADLRYVATHDSLTGLPNRLLFNDTLQAVLANAARQGTSFHVMFIDIDQFKNINDTLGHDVGDELLRSCADRLLGELPHVEMLARLGGDEFIVLLADSPDRPGLVDTLKAILAVFSAPVLIKSTEMQVTVSIGVSTFPQNGTDASSLLKHADIAMYRAKEQGKNTYQIYAQPMGAMLQEQVNLESHLWRALANKEFELHYQPRLSLKTGEITGVEALIRWRHPTLGLVPPLQFIPIAEKSGLIVPIGAWVLHEACRQNAAWRARGLAPLRVAVNLSARQFIRNDLMQGVLSALREAGLPADALELEITESLMMNQPEQVSKLLSRLKAKGVSVSVDDFGTGYSSLGYLKHFPVDTIKIDRSFITHIPDSESDKQITASVIALAHCLHLDVIAEGVETDAHVTFLREHGCDEIQGYHFSKPLTANDMTHLLGSHKASALSSALG